MYGRKYGEEVSTYHDKEAKKDDVGEEVTRLRKARGFLFQGA